MANLLFWNLQLRMGRCSQLTKKWITGGWALQTGSQQVKLLPVAEPDEAWGPDRLALGTAQQSEMQAAVKDPQNDKMVKGNQITADIQKVLDTFLGLPKWWPKCFANSRAVLSPWHAEGLTCSINYSNRTAFPQREFTKREHIHNLNKVFLHSQTRDQIFILTTITANFHESQNLTSSISFTFSWLLCIGMCFRLFFNHMEIHLWLSVPQQVTDFCSVLWIGKQLTVAQYRPCILSPSHHCCILHDNV